MIVLTMMQMIKIVCVGGGFVYGSLGMSHQATEDIAVMRALPNVPGTLSGRSCGGGSGNEGNCGITREHVTCGLGAAGKNVSSRILKISKSEQAIRIHKGERIAVFSTGANSG